MLRLDGKVAIVSGAGAGIGRSISRMFAGAGAAVVVSDLKAEAAEAVSQEIIGAGGRALGLQCNVTRAEDLAAVVDAAVATFGRLDVLVNNAGGGGPKPFDMPMDDFRWACELNVVSVLHLSQLAAPHMQAAGGRRQAAGGRRQAAGGRRQAAGGGAILNITSMAGENKNTRMASYGSS